MASIGGPGRVNGPHGSSSPCSLRRDVPHRTPIDPDFDRPDPLERTQNGLLRSRHFFWAFFFAAAFLGAAFLAAFFTAFLATGFLTAFLAAFASLRFDSLFRRILLGSLRNLLSHSLLHTLLCGHLVLHRLVFNARTLSPFTDVTAKALRRGSFFRGSAHGPPSDVTTRVRGALMCSGLPSTSSRTRSTRSSSTTRSWRRGSRLRRRIGRKCRGGVQGGSADVDSRRGGIGDSRSANCRCTRCCRVRKRSAETSNPVGRRHVIIRSTN
ncbi:MAG: hypothetical protein K0Q76_4197 [Panacagrimonas sp.]|nr:hypothetical protein [Panacagrimonas sp.]